MKRRTNRKMKRIVVICTALVMLFSTVPVNAATTITSKSTDKAKVEIDWNTRYHYSDLELQLKSMNKNFGKYSKLYPIGTNYEKMKTWCMEITNEAVPKTKKTEITIFGNIHGGEREGASCAMYSAWYLLENATKAEIANILKQYVIYVIPVINPSGYEQSFIYNTRPNVNKEAKDNYMDIDGDGYISAVSAVDAMKNVTGSCGNESNDANGDGIMANDVKSSGIDLNRNFDFLWGQDGKMDSEGPSAASEIEVKNVQKFIEKHKSMTSLATLHTGIQSVLYPWGYRGTHKDLDDMKDFAYMDKTSAKMTKDIATATQRNFYYKQSYQDYPTYSELIDYAYGKYNIHAYTIEVYQGGSSEGSAYDPNRDLRSDEGCSWNNKLPAVKEVYYTHQEAVKILEAAKVDPSKLQVKDKTSGQYRAWGATEGLLFKTSATAQMVNQAPEDQDVMVDGVMKGLLTMIKSEKAVKNIKLSVKATATRDHKVALTWKEPTGKVNGYQVYRATSAKGTYKKIATVSKESCINTKNVKKGTKYYYKIRAIREIKEKTSYGQWTQVSAVAK